MSAASRLQLSSDAREPFSVTIQQAAEEGFGGDSTLRRYIAEGRLPAVRLGRRYMLRRSDLEALQRPVVGRPKEHEAMEAAVARVVEAAPRLTQQQRARIVAALGGDR